MNGRKNSQNSKASPTSAGGNRPTAKQHRFNISINHLIPNTMKKLNLHHFHHEEIEKQQQNLLTGGQKDYCICTGPGCGCTCIWNASSNANSYSETYYFGSGGDINTNANDITQRG